MLRVKIRRDEGHLVGATFSYVIVGVGGVRRVESRVGRGAVPLLAVAERAGLRRLSDERLSVPTDRGAHAGLKVASLVAGMVAGADSIEDMALLRHGGMGRLFDRIYAPSTLGSFLRSSRFGHVRQLDAVAARVIANLAAQTPLLPDAEQIAYLDVDDTIRQTYGYAKQGVGYGYSGVEGLNALLAALSTPASAIVAARMRKGSANSARGAARLVADALKTSRACGASKLVIVRADSAFYGRDGIAAISRAGARCTITARQHPAVRRAIESIDEAAWTTIRYPNAIYDEQLQQWISDAQVAEVEFTAFASRPHAQQVTARLIVRRVRDANPNHLVPDAQGELFRRGASTPCSPTRRCRCSTPKPITAATRSSNKSSPTSRTDRSPTCPQVRSRQRRLADPGNDRVQPHPRPAASPPGSMPAPRPRRSAGS